MGPLRAALEARVLLWPGVVPTFMLDCPTYMICDHPFAVIVDGSFLIPALPPETLSSTPEVRVEPLRKSGLALEGWLRVRVRKPQDVLAALPLVRAAYEWTRPGS